MLSTCTLACVQGEIKKLYRRPISGIQCFSKTTLNCRRTDLVGGGGSPFKCLQKQKDSKILIEQTFYTLNSKSNGIHRDDAK